MTLIHEVNKEGQHRIVCVKDDGTNEVGEWAEGRDLAGLNDWRANTTPGIDGLPAGIFKAKEVPYQVLA